MKLTMLFSFLLATTTIAFAQKKTVVSNKKPQTTLDKKAVISDAAYDNAPAPAPRQEALSPATNSDEKYAVIVKENMSKIQEIEDGFLQKKKEYSQNKKMPQQNYTELNDARAKRLIELLGEPAYQFYIKNFNRQ